MRDFLQETIGVIGCIIIAILVIAAIYFFAYTLQVKEDNELWNDGHCDVCEGNWEYEQAVGHRSSTSYIYVCSKCGKRIEISEVR